MKQRVLWISALIVLLAAAVIGPVFLGLPGSRFGGLAITFFLGYCAIIVVAQLFSALIGVRTVLEEWTAERKEFRRMPLR